MKYSFFLGTLFSLFLSTVVYAQKTPLSEKEIPIFPGATVEVDAQKQAQEDYQDIHEGEPIKYSNVKVYTVSVVPDEVCRFYIEKLGAKEGFPEDDSDDLKPGVKTKPWFELSYFPDSWFEDQFEGNIKIHDGKWLKTALSKRKQWTQGEWLQAAYFEWEIVNNNGDLARYSIDIMDDNSFDSRAKKVSDKTMITITTHIEETE